MQGPGEDADIPVPNNSWILVEAPRAAELTAAQEGCQRWVCLTVEGAVEGAREARRRARGLVPPMLSSPPLSMTVREELSPRLSQPSVSAPLRPLPDLEGRNREGAGTLARQGTAPRIC